MTMTTPPSTSPIADFAALHGPALAADEVRYNILISALTAAVEQPNASLTTWTLGGPGACATQSPARSILLGRLDRAQCRAFADAVHDTDYPGVVGLDACATWFVERARERGHAFAPPLSMQLKTLDRAPRYPGAAGSARAMQPADAGLLLTWLEAFRLAAVPHDPAPTLAQAERSAASGRYMLWTVDGEPVSMAAIVRRLASTVAIAAVYTTPDRRGCGYAGSVVATLAERALAEGKRTACLFVDVANPSSNRCYDRVGFEPYCTSEHYLRQRCNVVS